MPNGGNPPPFPPTVMCQGGTTAVNPPVLPVPWAGTGRTITITWTAQGGSTFPTTGFFSWKPGSPNPGVVAQRISPNQLQLTYVAPPTPVVYSYNIKLNNCNEADPDIDNGQPPGDEDDNDG